MPLGVRDGGGMPFTRRSSSGLVWPLGRHWSSCFHFCQYRAACASTTTSAGLRRGGRRSRQRHGRGFQAVAERHPDGDVVFFPARHLCGVWPRPVHGWRDGHGNAGTTIKCNAETNYAHRFRRPDDPSPASRSTRTTPRFPRGVLGRHRERHDRHDGRQLPVHQRRPGGLRSGWPAGTVGAPIPVHDRPPLLFRAGHGVRRRMLNMTRVADVLFYRNAGSSWRRTTGSTTRNSLVARTTPGAGRASAGGRSSASSTTTSRCSQARLVGRATRTRSGLRTSGTATFNPRDVIVATGTPIRALGNTFSLKIYVRARHGKVPSRASRPVTASPRTEHPSRRDRWRRPSPIADDVIKRWRRLGLSDHLEYAAGRKYASSATTSRASRDLGELSER